MIPPVGRRDQMNGHLEDIVTHLTVTIMDWKKAGPYKRQAYEILTKNAFNNQSFFEITQEACDYCDYLIFEKHEDASRVIAIGCEKLLELHIALMIKTTGQLNAELPGVQNYYKARIQEYPELMRNVAKHLSTYGNTLGEQEMQNGQTWFDTASGQWVMWQNGQAVYVNAQAPQLTQDQQHAASMARRNSSQYTQQQPVYQQPPQGYPQPNNWGVNPAVQPYYQQPPNDMVNSYQTQQPQYAQPIPPGNNTYSGYSNNPNVPNLNTGTGLGPIIPHTPPQTRAPHPGSSAVQRHIDLPAPTTMDNTQPINPTQMPGHAPKPIAAATVPTKPVNPLMALVETHSGYECSYSYGQKNLKGILALHPILFDIERDKGIFELDANKKITGFKVVHYKENEVDYRTHETAQFFDKTRAGADTPDKRETRAMLASIQRKLFVEEKLAEIENDVLEGNVTAGADTSDLSNPLILSKTLHSEYGETDYIGCMLHAQPDKAARDMVTNRVVNFDHMCWNGIDYSGPAGEVVSRIRTVKTWLGLNDILNDLVDVGEPLVEWRMLNTIITNYINDLLLYHFNIAFTIESFNIDIDELIKYLLDEHQIRTEFTAMLSGLIETSLLPINGFHEDYHHYIELPDLGEDDEAHDVENLIIFTTLTDVTVLPIESSTIYLPYPKDKSITGPITKTTAIVTWESYPELYTAIHDRMENKHKRTAHVVFVTADGINLYIKKTASKDAYVIIRGE